MKYCKLMMSLQAASSCVSWSKVGSAPFLPESLSGNIETIEVVEEIMSLYNPEWVSEFFDEYGDKEWHRLVQTPTEEVKLHIHSRYIREHIPPGIRVLEVGAGAGRFTQILVEMGNRVVVADISQVQLNLNRQHAAELGFGNGVQDWMRLDFCFKQPLGGAGRPIGGNKTRPDPMAAASTA